LVNVISVIAVWRRREETSSRFVKGAKSAFFEKRKEMQIKYEDVQRI
jgi:hypothetical protein